MTVPALKNYLKKVGSGGAKELADKMGTHANYLHQIATGFRRPSPAFAISLHKATEGEVHYSETLKNQASKVWPPDMFFYHEAWKDKK